MSEKNYTEKNYDDFMQDYSLENLKKMPLEDYVSFYRTITYASKDRPFFGTIRGFDPKYFGIYKIADPNNNEPKDTNNLENANGYAWQKDLGNNIEEAYEKVRKIIIKIVEIAEKIKRHEDTAENLLQQIESIDKLGQAFKWKIAYLYSDRQLINCYSKDKLLELLRKLIPNETIENNISVSNLQLKLIKIKDERSNEFEKAFKSLWGKDNNNNEDKTMANEKTLAQECAELLKNTKNIILHGAPGTGKTYLAKEKIAPELAGLLGIKKEDVEIGFVQFHPSYDYTDFVEGIRPTTDGKFNLEDGIFKKFCEKAINNSEHILKNTAAVNSSYRDFLKALKDFVRDFENKIPTHLSESMKFLENKLNALESTSDNVDHNVFKELFLLKIELRWFIEELQTTSTIFDNNLRESFKNLKEQLLNQLNNFNYRNGLHTCWDFLMQEASKHDENKPLKIGNESYLKKSSKLLQRISNNKREPYLTFERLKEVYEHKDKNKKYKQQCQNIIDYMRNNYKLENYTNEKLEDDVFDEKTPNHSENRNSFVFIIDEINRGELSKIFGELFFSIDPEYRSTKGAILTQYANMADKPNKFDDALGIKEEKENKGNYGHFFVPENVYIIGTMNDIDRSVESMDLAMRRRFTFKEITAENSQKAMLTESNEKLKGIDNIDKLKNRMSNLNEAIIKDEIGLSTDYQIGAAYFLKYSNYMGEEKPFDALWEYNLAPLLKEYLRGQDPDGEKLKKLEDAYKNDKNSKDQPGEQQQ